MAGCGGVRRSRRLAGCLLAVVLPMAVSVYATPLLDFTLADLHRSEPRPLDEFRGKLVLISFFEPDCRWCYRQMRAFNRLGRQCDASLQPLAVGINGSVAQLRRELRRAKVKFPAFRASRRFLDDAGGVPATPWTLLLDPAGKVMATLRGYIPYEQLAAVFAEQCPATGPG